MGQEVRANRLEVPLGGSGDGANGLEVLIGTPARRQGRESNVDGLNGSHGQEQSHAG